MRAEGGSGRTNYKIQNTNDKMMRVGANEAGGLEEREQKVAKYAGEGGTGRTPVPLEGTSRGV
jgi:hypothetical protein